MKTKFIYQNEIVEVIFDIWSDIMPFREFHGTINLSVGILNMRKQSNFSCSVPNLNEACKADCAIGTSECVSKCAPEDTNCWRDCFREDTICIDRKNSSLFMIFS